MTSTAASNHGDVLHRYSRQMILPQIGLEGQGILSNSKVLVVGAGGIGSTVLMYLAASGIPVTVLDFDIVETSNLHRQIIHETDKQGSTKVSSATQRLKAINPTLDYAAITEKLTTDNASDIISQYELIIDATDNFNARYIINDACVLNNKPLISGSAVGFEGQITVIIPFKTACYRCLYPKESFAESCRSCANAGVLGPVPGLIGCLQAIEATKFLLINGRAKKQFNRNGGDEASSTSENDGVNAGKAATAVPALGQNDELECLTGRQILYDGTTGGFHTFSLPKRNLDCCVCGDHPTVKTMSDTAVAIQKNSEMNAQAMSKFKVNLLPHNIITTQDFRNTIIHRVSKAVCGRKLNQNIVVPVIVLDVRSRVQFELSNFSYSNELNSGNTKVILYKSVSECFDKVEGYSAVDTVVDTTTAANTAEHAADSGTGATADATTTTAATVATTAIKNTVTVITTAAEPTVMTQIHLISCPLETLRGGKTGTVEQKQAKMTEEMNGLCRIQHDLCDQFTACVEKALNLSAEEMSTFDTNIPIYVLCRRGVDSTTATGLLLEHCAAKLKFKKTKCNTEDNEEGAGECEDNENPVPSSCSKTLIKNVAGGLTAWKEQVEPSFPMY